MNEDRREKIMGYLKETRLGAFRRVYDEVLTKCLKARKGPEEFLLDLLEQEIAARRVSALKNRTKNAKFPQVKDLDSFKESSGFDKTSLYIREIPEKDIDKYFRLLGPYDKAGGFSIEGVGSIVFDNVNGSYFNVLGLPMGKLQELFRKIDLDLLDFVR